MPLLILPFYTSILILLFKSLTIDVTCQMINPPQMAIKKPMALDPKPLNSDFFKTLLEWETKSSHISFASYFIIPQIPINPNS